MMPGILSDNRNPNSLASRMRSRRFEYINSMIECLAWENPDPVTVLDVGGTLAYWRRHLPLVHPSIALTVDLVNTKPDTELLDRHRPGVELLREHIGYVWRHDATKLHGFFQAGSYDLVVSNSVIEHVGPTADVAAMAEGIRTVGRAYYVQTPARGVPIEPHFLLPGWQWWPEQLRAALLARWQIGWYGPYPSHAEALEAVRSVRLLSKRDMTGLFPDGEIGHEYAGFFIKSHIAWRMPEGFDR